LLFYTTNWTHACLHRLLPTGTLRLVVWHVWTILSMLLPPKEGVSRFLRNARIIYQMTRVHIPDDGKITLDTVRTSNLSFIT